MERFALILPLMAALALPVAAQTWQMPQANEAPTAPGTAEPTLPTPDPDASGVERALDGILRDLFGRFEPHMRDLGREMENTFNDYKPALDSITSLMDDIKNYEMPERLPNGDVIIRRKADAPPPPPLDNIPGLGDKSAVPQTGETAPGRDDGAPKLTPMPPANGPQINL